MWFKWGENFPIFFFLANTLVINNLIAMLYNCFIFLLRNKFNNEINKKMLCSHRFREFHECQWFIGTDCFYLQPRCSCAWFVRTHTHTHTLITNSVLFWFIPRLGFCLLLLLYFFILRHCLVFSKRWAFALYGNVIYLF